MVWCIRALQSAKRPPIADENRRKRDFYTRLRQLDAEVKEEIKARDEAESTDYGLEFSPDAAPGAAENSKTTAGAGKPAEKTVQNLPWTDSLRGSSVVSKGGLPQKSNKPVLTRPASGSTFGSALFTTPDKLRAPLKSSRSPEGQVPQVTSLRGTMKPKQGGEAFHTFVNKSDDFEGLSKPATHKFTAQIADRAGAVTPKQVTIEE